MKFLSAPSLVGSKEYLTKKMADVKSVVKKNSIKKISNGSLSLSGGVNKKY